MLRKITIFWVSIALLMLSFIQTVRANEILSQQLKNDIELTLVEYYTEIRNYNTESQIDRLQLLDTMIEDYNITEGYSEKLGYAQIVNDFKLQELQGSVYPILDQQLEGVFMDLSGDKGLILCFHGGGGSSAGWEVDGKGEYLNNMRKAGYSYLCPSSLDRKNKKWSNDDTPKNVDVIHLDSMLDELGVSKDIPIYLVGHSNGGGFSSRYSVFSQRSKYIKAIQYANSSGIKGVISHEIYQLPTLFAYSECDPKHAVEDVEEAMDMLLNKGIPISNVKLDSIYSLKPEVEHCHKFIDSSLFAKVFFSNY